MGMTTTTTPRHPATYFHVGKYTLYSAPYDQHPPSLDICTVPHSLCLNMLKTTFIKTTFISIQRTKLRLIAIV